MLKAVLIDGSAVSRGLLNTILTDGGYDVRGHTHTAALGLALMLKHQPHLVCVAREQVEDGSGIVEEIRAQWPKTLVFMVSGGIDAAGLQGALARGVSGFIVKPFNADTVLKTIRNTVIAMVRRQQKAAADANATSRPSPVPAADGSGRQAA